MLQRLFSSLLLIGAVLARDPMHGHEKYDPFDGTESFMRKHMVMMRTNFMSACKFEDTNGVCTVTSVAPDSDDPGHVIVLHDFAPDSGESVETGQEYKNFNYQHETGWVEKKHIAAGNSYDCIKKVKLSGPCPDIMYLFNKFDRADGSEAYDESEEIDPKEL